MAFAADPKACASGPTAPFLAPGRDAEGRLSRASPAFWNLELARPFEVDIADLDFNVVIRKRTATGLDFSPEFDLQALLPPRSERGRKIPVHLDLAGICFFSPAEISMYGNLYPVHSCYIFDLGDIAEYRIKYDELLSIPHRTGDGSVHFAVDRTCLAVDCRCSNREACKNDQHDKNFFVPGQSAHLESPFSITLRRHHAMDIPCVIELDMKTRHIPFSPQSSTHNAYMRRTSCASPTDARGESLRAAALHAACLPRQAKPPWLSGRGRCRP